MIIVIISKGFALSLPITLAQLLPPTLHTQCEQLQLCAGSTLFTTGQQPQWMFYVVEGEVVLERFGQNGQMACLQRTQGGFVGEASLTASRYHCDGRTTRISRLTRIPVRAFERVLREDPAFASRWIDTLSREVRRLRLQNERLSLPKVQDRVLHLVETEGQKGHYTLNGSLKDLAQQLAVTHEALYRCLAQLQTSGQVVRSPQGLSLG